MEPTVSIHAYRRVQKENEELRRECELLRKLTKAAGVYNFETDSIKECTPAPRVNSKTHQWELCLEDLIF